MRSVEWTDDEVKDARTWVDKETMVQLTREDIEEIASRVHKERSTQNVLGSTRSELTRIMKQINSVLRDKQKVQND